MLGALRAVWCPQAMVVSFKLETDQAILLQKVGGGPAGSRGHPTCCGGGPASLRCPRRLAAPHLTLPGVRRY